MTREEAISNLRTIMGKIPFGKSFDAYFDACSVAIQSLEAWDKVKNDLDDLWLKGYSPHTEVMEIIERHLEEVE